MSENKAGSPEHSATQAAPKNVSGNDGGGDARAGRDDSESADSSSASAPLEGAGDRMQPDAAREVLVNDREDATDAASAGADAIADKAQGRGQSANNASPGESDARAEAGSTAHAAAPVGTKPAGRGLAWLALLFALLAVAATAYLGWMLWQARDAAQELASVGETNQAQINQFQRAITDVEKRVESERAARSSEAKALREQLAQANTLIEGQSRRLL
ncbi:MAG: hypothetical protein WBN40_08170, partial [Pseudomonadales bacterium]